MNKAMKIACGLLVCALVIFGGLMCRLLSERLTSGEPGQETAIPDESVQEDTGHTEDMQEAEPELGEQQPGSKPEGSQMTETELEPETEFEPEPEPEPQVISVTVSAVGDCALGPVQTRGYSDSFYEYYDTFGEDYFFAGVKEIFEADDFTLVNLECVLTNETERVEKKWNIKGYPEYTGILLAGDIEGCSLGNNHSSDYGAASHEETKQALADAGILYAVNEITAVYETESGISIGIVSANMLSKGETCENYMREGIEALRDGGADIVIACCHWGVEREYYPTDYQEDTGHKLIDWGADLVIGNHPHVLQGIEVYKGKVICYSLGNFCFGANGNPSDKDTLIFQQTFTFTDGVLEEQTDARIIPCRLSSVTKKNDYQPTILTDEDKQDIIDKMNRYSKAYREISFDEDGRLLADEPSDAKEE